MTNGPEEAVCATETRRPPATAVGGLRPRLAETQQRRPFTSIGPSLFELEASRSVSPRTATLQPVRLKTIQRPNDADPATPSHIEFDVRKFLLDQKANEPLHPSALFRTSAVVEENRTNTLSKRKLLARMEHSKTSNTSSLNHVRSSTSLQPDEDTVSHFYTIEKLSESCFHAVRSKQFKIWQFLPGAEERSKSSSGVSANASSGGANSLMNLERPSRRMDVIDLDKCFDFAMQFVKTKNRTNVGLLTNQQLATLDRDVITIQAKVALRYAKAQIGREPEAAICKKSTDAATARELLNDEQKALAQTLFEQKWSDVVLGEVEAMLTRAFLEQGMLLHKTRVHYGKCFFKLEQLYNERTKELSLICDELERTRAELHLTSKHHAQDMHQMKIQHEEEIRHLTAGFESRREDMERKLAESKEQMIKMSDTMKTLNTIFRQMREDTDKVKAVEVRENFIKLEKKFEVAKEELERLQPLVQLNQRLQEQKELVIHENNALKEKIANFDPLIASKDEIIGNLMEQQSELVATQELRAAHEEELRRLEECKATEEDEDEVDYDRMGNSPPRTPSYRSRDRESAAVCVRCKETLRTMSQAGSLVTATPISGMDSSQIYENYVIRDSGVFEPRKKRIQCMYFRILLPNLRGRRPQRDLSWTLSCMRSIIFAKQLDDAMCKCSGGAFPLRIRMPEFVFSWFSPWRSLRDDKAAMRDGDSDPFGEDDSAEVAAGRRASVGATKERTEEQKQLQADEDRWCLYYGIKALVQEGHLEAKQFLSLLDEKHGEDEQVFMLYCYRVLDVLLGGKINWGPMRDHVSYDHFSVQYEKTFGGRQSSSDLLRSIQSAPRVPKTIWISPYHASLATSIVLGKATEAEQMALDKKLLAFAVTNLSEHERPSVYLTPTNADWFQNADSSSKTPRQPHNFDAEGDHADEREAVSLQFVDASLWIELMMMEYKEEQAHRRAAIRLMFQTATSSSFMGSIGGRASTSGSSANSMDMEQFRIMIRTLNDEIPSFMVATLFRTAFMRGNGAVSYESFLEAAEYAQFFSSCMRLENPVASLARLNAEGGGHKHDPRGPSHAAMSTNARAAFLADKYFTLMHKQMEIMTAELPVWSRNHADTLVFELTSSLIDENGSSSGGGALADGVHLLTTFNRLLGALLLSTLVKKDATGGVLSSKNIFCLEKALQALLDCIRVGEKSTVEQLIDTVRQNLSVKRVQSRFRKHLQRDHGAPLVIRPLFHPSYSSQHSGRVVPPRHAERPVKWLLFVIADLLRRLLRSDKAQCLLLELSGVSSVIMQSSNGAVKSLTHEFYAGIGPAPKPLLVEMLYDCMVERFGTRGETEKLLHDVFVNARSRVRENQPLAVLFSYLCGMSDASPDDRLMAQNEAVAFLLAVVRCGLHAFRVVNSLPASHSSAGLADTQQSDGDDLIGQPAAEGILFAAFGKLGVDQKQRMKLRLEEQMTIWETPSVATSPSGMLSGSSAMKSDAELLLQPFMVAEAFLVLALGEWKWYIQYRLNELRVICCSMEAEIAQFGSSLPLDSIAKMLQKAKVSFNNDELCMVFRRVCLTEQRENQAAQASAKSLHSAFSTSKLSSLPPSIATGNHMSDRLAAACYPLIARETLMELRKLEHSSITPFRLVTPADDKADFLIETWRAYDEPFRALLDELRRVGKNNDIQAEAESRRTPVSGARSLQMEEMHLSSSISGDKLSSQDVSQLEAQHKLFLEWLEKMNDELGKPPQDTAAGRHTSARHLNELNNASRASNANSPRGPATGEMSDDAKDALLNSQFTIVNETWKMFRQLLISFSRLRTLAGLGDGPLLDKWDAPRPST